ncbi:(R)-stereoselective amidase [Planctomycetes bacterium Pan216]|uniref:(R)-stereoselective amidase n=1 Tax=Kolteria novifilia TaxID=2527975 RepID=A0A518B5I1_9BACT|nr:(R)-stereoselective amidase [Planctomycetes bacterium Pan216]
MSPVVASIQLETIPLAIDDNLDRADQLIRQACHDGAEIVVLPEFFHTGYILSSYCLDHAEPIGGKYTKWIKSRSMRHGIYLGTCLAEKSYDGHFDTFVLCTPSGDVMTYRKRYPAPFEHSYFRAGKSEGIFHTQLGRIGVMICWDMIQRPLMREMRGRIDLLLISAAWPDHAGGNLPFPIMGPRIRQKCLQRPGDLAQKLDVPVVFCNMTGQFCSFLPDLGLEFSSPFVGASSVIDAGGTVLDRLGREEAIATAPVSLPGSGEHQILKAA